MLARSGIFPIIGIEFNFFFFLCFRMDSDKELQQTSRSILLSSDDEYRTASENGRQSSSDWGETLPPSPPLNRTPISRVKERAR